MSLSSLYNITVTVQRPAVTQGDYGEKIETFANQITGMECRLQRKRSNEIVRADRETVISDFSLYCDVSNSLQADDRVVYDSENYLVVGFDPDVDRAGVFQKVDLRKID